MYCKNVKLWAIGQGDTGTIASRVRCKKWNCEYCAQINRVQWRFRVMRSFDALDIDAMWFITLTSRHVGHRATHLKNMQKSISKLIKRMRRINADDSEFAYVRVYENHADGYYHAHMLTVWSPKPHKRTNKKYVYQRGARKQTLNVKKWLKDNAHECGLGYIAHVREVAIFSTDDDDNPALRVVNYITKYMTKDIQTDIERKKVPHLRQIQASQNIPPSKALSIDSDLSWHVQSRLHVYDYHMLTHPVHDSQLRIEITESHFENSSIYPLLIEYDIIDK